MAGDEYDEAGVGYGHQYQDRRSERRHGRKRECQRQTRRDVLGAVFVEEPVQHKDPGDGRCSAADRSDAS